MWLVWCGSLALFHPVRVFLPSPVLSVPLSCKSTSCCWWHHNGDRLSGLSRSPEGAALPVVHVLCHPSSPGLDRNNFNIGDTRLPWRAGFQSPGWFKERHEDLWVWTWPQKILGQCAENVQMLWSNEQNGLVWSAEWFAALILLLRWDRSVHRWMEWAMLSEGQAVASGQPCFSPGIWSVHWCYSSPCPRVLHVDVLPDLLRWEAFALTDLPLHVLHKTGKENVIQFSFYHIHWNWENKYRLTSPKVVNVHQISKYSQLYWFIHYCLFLNSKSKNHVFITIFDIVVFVIFASFVCIWTYTIL